jgi:hypothetical protein
MHIDVIGLTLLSAMLSALSQMAFKAGMTSAGVSIQAPRCQPVQSD